MKIKIIFSVFLMMICQLKAQQSNILEEARLFERQFKTMDAIRKYESFLLDEPNNITVLVRLSELYCMEGSANPTESKSLYASALAFDIDEAVVLYEKARKLEPGLMANNLDLAMAYKKTGKSGKAIELLNYQLKLPKKTKEDQEIKLKSKQLLESLK